ncbi:hypothetical protein [Paenibacillus sp. KN14-4R]|uniref:hypothetical protein n=1 Tax=Paenibacillus sp. KN14-4R TaxID=3445773 RepID=UPI003FA15947
MNVYEWSAVGALVTFVVLAGYLITTLRMAKKTLYQIDMKLSHAVETLNVTAKQSKQLMRVWRGLSEEIYVDVRSLRGVVEAVGGFGNVVREMITSLSRVSTWMSRSSDPPSKAAKVTETKATTAEAVDWFTLGTELFRKCKDLRGKPLGKEHAETHTKE